MITNPAAFAGTFAGIPAARGRHTLRTLGAGAILAVMLGTCQAASPTPPLPILPPPTPTLVSPASPVKAFRELLAMTPEQRTAALEARTEAQRRSLRTRLAEYEALSPRRREERLQATDLYWHLQQLMRRTPAERAPILASAPPDLLPLLNERLAHWDRLPSTDQQALLQHEAAIRYFAAPPPIQPPPLPTDQTPASGTTSLAPGAPLSLRLQAELARFSQLPAEERSRIESQWRQFFEAPQPRTQPALQAMSATERQEMETVLERFRALPPEQRRQCIASFTRLAQLPPAERATFLRNVERWNAATPAERDVWRSLVNKLPDFPPLPDTTTPPPLPTPPAPRPQLTTNAAP